MNAAQPATDSGTSLRNGSPSSVNENMRLSSSWKTPNAASARRSR